MRDPSFAGIAVTLLFVAWAVREWWINRQLQRHGTVTTATILKTGRERWTRNVAFYAIYRFQTGEATPTAYGRRQAVRYEHYKSWQEGSTVTICYLSHKPNTSRLWGADKDNASRNEAIGIASFCAIITLIIGLRLF